MGDKLQNESSLMMSVGCLDIILYNETFPPFVTGLFIKIDEIRLFYVDCVMSGYPDASIIMFKQLRQTV